MKKIKKIRDETIGKFSVTIIFVLLAILLFVPKSNREIPTIFGVMGVATVFLGIASILLCNVLVLIDKETGLFKRYQHLEPATDKQLNDNYLRVADFEMIGSPRSTGIFKDYTLNNSIENFAKIYNFIYTCFCYSVLHPFFDYNVMVRNDGNHLLGYLDYLFATDIFVSYIRKRHKKLFKLFKIHVLKSYCSRNIKRNAKNVSADLFVSDNGKVVMDRGRQNFLYEPDFITFNRGTETLFEAEYFNDLQYIHCAPFVQYMIQHRVFEKFNKYLKKLIKRKKNGFNRII